MKVFNDFRCSQCGTVTEMYRPISVRVTDCPECTGPAKRIIRPIRTVLETDSGSFPGATLKWERDRKVKMRRELRDSAFSHEHGTIMRDNPSDYNPQLLGAGIE